MKPSSDAPARIKVGNELTPILCDKVCRKIGEDWRSLGRYFDINENELDNINVEQHKNHEKAAQVLKKWKEKTGYTTWEQLKPVLENLDRKDIVWEIEEQHPSLCIVDLQTQVRTAEQPGLMSNGGTRDTETLQSPDRKRIVGKFPDGCSFKLDLQTENEQLTRVEYKLKGTESQWEVLRKDYHKSYPYYITKPEDKILFVKVENLRVYCEVDFKFSFEDSKAKRHQCFEVLITDICTYEIPSICNQLRILIPDPCFSNQFPWIDQDPPLPEYLDWRDGINPGSKISKEKPIQEFAMKYLERNFVDLNQVICFPSMVDEQIDTICIPRLFTELFKEELTEGIRAVLSDYDLYHHATLLNFKPQEHIKPICSANRVVIFYSKLNLIFIVRAASSSDCINQESKNCSADVKYFTSINKPVIEEKAITILGVVACHSVERKDLEEELKFQFSSKFELHNVLFICRDELKTYETLYSWWRNDFYEYCFKKKSQTKDEELFKKVIGLTMLIIAKCDEELPTLNSDTLEQIKSLILNPEQKNAINDRELKKIITAGFGFGKSVVGREIVKSFYLKSSKKATLYYICCDHFSLFECEMREFTDGLKKYPNNNVEIVCENLLELWQYMCKNENMYENNDFSLLKLLSYYSKNSSTEVNFVLDELPGEYVREEDVNKLKKLFSSSLKESLVVFLPKSIEKNRYLNKDGEKQIFESTYFNGEKIGMKSITLDKSMRVTKSIKSLIDSAQDTISKSNTILFQNSNIDKDSHSNMETQHNSTQDMEIPYNKNNSAQQKTEDNNLSTAQSATQQEYPSRVQQEDDATTVKGYHDYDLDEGAKIVSNPQNVVGSKVNIETEFLFKPGVSGHSIEGEKPKIIFLPSLIWTEVSSAKVLSVVLEKICFDARGTTVICNNMDEVKLIAYAIDIIEGYEAVVYSPHLRKVTPTIKEKILVTKKIKKSKLNVLVADSRAMCGAESEVVIVLVKPEEYYLRHVIADVCSRCNSHLVVFVLPFENADFQKGGTIQEVLDNWSEDIVEKIQVKISNDENQLWSCKDCFRYINDECKDFKDRGVKKENFIKYIENVRFKINHESDLIYKRMVFDTFNKSKSMEKGVKHEARLATLHDYSATDDNEEKVFVLKDQAKMGNILDNSELLLQLKMKIGKDWVNLGRFLSVSDNELDVIDAENNDDLEEKAYRMLCTWKNQQKFPTLEALANAIYKINRLDLMGVMEKFSNKSFERENPLKSSIEEKESIVDLQTQARTAEQPGSMSDEINQQKKNKLARTLGDSWKAFAEAVPLSRVLISSIEVEERNEEDRAHRVLLHWYRSSPDEFTNTNVIKKLKTLHRNDIILDVFGREFLADKVDGINPPRSSRAEKVDGVIPPGSSCGAPTVSDLSFSQISKLGDMLDFDDGWEDLAAFAFENDDVMQENIQNLHRDYYGGGNPAHSFLIKLIQRYPTLTVKEFVNNCKECKRNDIVLYASKVLKNHDSTLMDLEDSELRALADKVCGKGVLGDWREIAITFPEFSPDDIRKLDGTRRIPNSFSPSRKLFEKIRQVHPTFKLEDLAIACERNNRPRIDVALKLRHFIAELSGK